MYESRTSAAAPLTYDQICTAQRLQEVLTYGATPYPAPLVFTDEEGDEGDPFQADYLLDEDELLTDDEHAFTWI